MRILLLSVLLSTLGNADIVKLVKAGLSPDTIEAKITSSETRFDTSTDALIALAEQGVPDRVIRKMIEAPARVTAAPPRPAARAAAPTPRTNKPVRQIAARRYDVTLHGENGGKCEAELRVDGKGLKASRCGALDFEVAWSAVETACHDYGFRGALTINGRRLSTNTPAEAKRIVEQVRERVAIAACRQ